MTVIVSTTHQYSVEYQGPRAKYISYFNPLASNRKLFLAENLKLADEISGIVSIGVR